MAQYDFHYLPLEGKITGKQVLQQTEDAINDLGNRIVDIETDTEAITEAVEIAQDAKNTADNAETIANDAMDVAQAERESAQEAAQEANQAATNAANSASSASTTATQLMEYLATKEEITAPAVDPTLTISGAAADSKVVGDIVKETTEKSKNLIINKIAGYTISSDGTFYASSGYDIYVAPITQGITYTFTRGENSTSNYGLYTTYPTTASVTYDNTRHTGQRTFTAPITGYVGFRTASDFEYAQIEVGSVATSYQSPSYMTANDKTAREDILTINETINGQYIPLTLPTRQSNGYYTAPIGSNISFVSGSGYYYSAIDLSQYATKKVRITMASTSTTSTRAVAMCNADGLVGDRYMEKDIVGAGGQVELDISDTYNRLYISYSTNTTSFSVDIVNKVGLIEQVAEIKKGVVYVAYDGSDDNTGEKASPFLTLQKAVNSGADIVSVKAGEYAGFTVGGRSNPLTILLTDMPNFDISVASPKIKITTDTNFGYGVYAYNCTSISLSDVWVDGVSADCIRCDNVGRVDATRCIVSNNVNAESMGIRLTNCNGTLKDCLAYNIIKDGFNIHGYGNTEFINCVAHDCGDDGISHHDGCTGLILGGEYYNNVKAGVASPYGNAKIDIHNVYTHNNAYGIYTMSNGGSARPQGRIANCVIKQNSTKDIIALTVDLVGWNNIYDTKDVNAATNFVEY